MIIYSTDVYAYCTVFQQRRPLWLEITLHSCGRRGEKQIISWISRHFVRECVANTTTWKRFLTELSSVSLWLVSQDLLSIPQYSLLSQVRTLLQSYWTLFCISLTCTLGSLINPLILVVVPVFIAPCWPQQYIHL